MAITSPKWIQKALPASSKGKLHSALHIAQGKKIPAKKLTKALHSSNLHIKRMANLAKTLKSFHK